VDPEHFRAILVRQREPLVVTARGGLFNDTHKYLTSYKGLAFFTKTTSELVLPLGCEIIKSEKIWIP
jgi:hypothetical protein